MKTFIAYQLPGEEIIHYCLGNAQSVENIEALTDETSIVLHSFTGDHIIQVTGLTPVDPNDFVLFYLEPSETNTEKSDYLNQFSQLKEAMAAGRFQKVILSRTKGVETQKTPLEVFQKLTKNYKNTLNYIISNPTIGTWMGATPETLLTTTGQMVETMALAGTKTPKDTWTPKEFEEQDLVTQSIVKALTAGNCGKIELEGPTTIDAGKVQHLKTAITATMNRSDDWKKILKALHPTPAVCGTPTKEALQYIPQLEGHQRHFYTGFIGLINAQNKAFYVNLRCMEFYPNLAKLYIGGGITPPSEAEAEWLETERKSQTLADFLHD